jgi:predicted O-methyltransferase YrrM
MTSSLQTRKMNSLIKCITEFWKAHSLSQALCRLKNSQNPFLKFAAPGHFYSPIPDINYIKEHSEDLFARERTSCPGIDIARQEQISLIKELASYYGQLTFSENKRDGDRYYFSNRYFGHGSSIILYSLMRHFHPQNIVEVGSGFSSAAMLDVNDHFFDGSIRFTFIEPYPERLLSLLTERDRTIHHICVDIAQHVPQTVYTRLKKNDILFIDSSHVAKVGSDVVFLITEILPILRKGVLIHIHDIYWPFEYPEDWFLSGTAWNEAYVVKAFLQFNSSFEILLFNSYLTIHHQDLMKQYLPLFLPDGGSSLWIRKAS